MAGFSTILKKWKETDQISSSQSFGSLFLKWAKIDVSPVVSGPVISKKLAGPVLGKKLKKPRIVKEKLNELVEADKNKLSEYLENSIRDSSKKLYSPYWRKYQQFCADRKFSLNSSEAVSLFMISLAEKSESKSSAISARSAIKYFLKLNDPAKKSSTDSFLVQRISKSIVKKYARQVKKAKTLDSSVIKSLVLSLLDRGTFKDERSANFFLLQYTLFARFEEVASLKYGNIKVLESGHIEVTIEKAKNYEVWDSKKSLVACGGDGFDPVSILKSYHSKVDSEFLFPNFRKGRKGKIEFLDSSVSYANMLKLLRSALDNLGLNGHEYSLHSLRSGSLSEAANSSVDRTLLQRHGRWKSDQMVNYYHKLSLDNRLAAPRALGFYD